MKWYKRLLVVFPLAVALFIGSTVSAWAEPTYWDGSGYPILNADTRTVGTLNFNPLSEKDVSLMKDFLSGNSKDWMVFQSNSDICFAFFSGIDYSKITCTSNSSYDRIEFPPCTMWSIRFNGKTGEPVPEPSVTASGYKYFRKRVHTSRVPINTIGLVFYPLLELTSIDLSSLKHVWKGAPITGGTVYFEYDLDSEIKPPVSSEPEPEPEPTPPPVVSYPDFPVVGPTDNQYVPYDTTVWNQFVKHLKTNIGSVVTIGLLLLAAIVGIKILVKIVNHYAK